MRYYRVQISRADAEKVPANLRAAAAEGALFVGVDGHLCSSAKAAHLVSHELAVELLAIALRRWGDRYGSSLATQVESVDAGDDKQMLRARIMRDTGAAKIAVQSAWLARFEHQQADYEAAAEPRRTGTA